MRGNPAALACIAAPIMQHSWGRYCVITHGCVVAAVGRSYASHSACASHAIACKLDSLAHHGDLPIRPHAGHRAVLGIGERAEMLSHTVLDQVPDVLRSLGKLSDVSLDHRPRAYAALVSCGVAPTLVTVSLAYHAIVDGDGELPVHAHGRGPARPKSLVAHHSVPSLLELSLSVVSESDRRHGVRRALARLGGAPMSEI